MRHKGEGGGVMRLPAVPACMWRAGGVVQHDPGVRRFLLQYHIPTLIQLGILAYVFSAWGYLSKVG